MYRTSRLKITEISPHLICVLCGGYFIDATSIIECLHSFCKTCIVRYLESSKYCPICDVLVHKTRPLQNIRQDQILQDLVYKLVPGLFKKEMKRRRDYYKKHPVPEFIEQTRKTSKQNGDFQERVIYTEDESISLSLEFSYNGYPPVWGRDEERNKVTDRRYLLCPAAVTLAHLKKFIRMKFSLSDHHKIDIFHTDEILCDSYTLIDIAYIFTWRRQGPLRLFYTVYENPAKRLKMAEPEPTSKPSSENNNSSSGGVGVGVVATSATDGTTANNVGGAIPAANGNPPTESQQPDRRGAGGATKTEAVPEPSALEGVRAGTPRAVPISAELSSQRAKEPREIVFNGQMVVNGHEPGIVDTSVIKTEPLIADGLSVTS